MKNHTEVLVGELPNCDFCAQQNIVRQALYDGRVHGVSSWAHMCQRHYEVHGVGLGLGVGQKLVVRPVKARVSPEPWTIGAVLADRARRRGES